MMEFLGELAGGWAIVWTVLLFAVIVALTENELGLLSFGVLVFGILAMELTGITALWSWVVANPLQLLIYALLYVLIGGVWSLLKWWLFVRRKSPEIKESFDRWTKDHEGVPRAEFYTSRYNPANISENQERIMRWMIWWVPSLFWTVMSDLIRGIWNRVYDMMAGGYRAIMTRIVSGAIDR